jgi:hypothetical protein
MSNIVIEVYEDLPKTNEDPEFLTDIDIIFPLNTRVDRVNKCCMDHIPGEIFSLYSAEKVVNSDEPVRDLYPVEYITVLKALLL